MSGVNYLNATCANTTRGTSGVKVLNAKCVKHVALKDLTLHV